MPYRCALAGLLFLFLGLGATRRYALTNTAGVDWFRAPGGEVFFSNGVDVVDDKTAAPRLKSWGFNTIGAWSDAAFESGEMPFTGELHLGGALGFPWCDFFNDRFAAGIEAAAQSAGRKYRGNPRLIGYFSDNELGWWGPSIFLYHLQQPRESTTRKKLFALLRAHYHGDFAALENDFKIGEASDWEALQSETVPKLWIRPGGQAMRAINEFISAAADRYYSLVSNALRRADSGHLFMGDRYAGYFERPVAEAAARYLDVISTNYGAEFLDGSLSHFYLASLHEITRKPLLISEYYFAARQNNSGNTNRGDIFPTVNTQADRARSFVRNLTALAARPYVVGAHWFQYRDEPRGGRPGDGEDYNMGLIDTSGTAYPELTGAARSLDLIRIHSAAKSQVATGHPPRAPADPWKGLLDWPRERAFVAPEETAAPADLYLCRDRTALWLGLHYMDFAEPKMYRTSEDFTQDLPRAEIELAGFGKFTIAVLANGDLKVSSPRVRARLIGHGTRSVILAELPLSPAVRCKFRSAGSAWHASWTEKR